MVKYILILALAFCFVLPASGQEKEQKGEFNIKAGFYNSPDMALAFGLGYTHWLSRDYGISVDVEFSNYDSEEEEILGLEDPLFTYLSVPAHLNIVGKTSTGEDLSFYFGAGLSAAYRSATERLVWIPEDEWEKSGFSFGINAALGLQFSRFFVEGRFVNYFFETLEENDMPDNQYSIMAGVRF